MKIVLNKMIILAVIIELMQLTGCGLNRVDDYILKNPGALEPKIPNTARYITHQFNFLSKYRLSHDWPYGFDICKYTTIELPDEQEDGTWYGSYKRLGSVFEYRDKTLQEKRSNAYPDRNFDIRYLSNDNYFRSNKVINKGKQEEHGFTPICEQSFIRTRQAIVIQLRKVTKNENIKNYTNSSNKSVSKTKTIVNGNEWLVTHYDLNRKNNNVITSLEEKWSLPIKDTGYLYDFSFLAIPESRSFQKEYKRLKAIFMHLIESVKIEKLDKKEAAKERAHIKSIIKGIENYEAKVKKKNSVIRILQ